MGSCYEIISLGGSNAEAAFRQPSSRPLSALTFGMPFSATKVRAIRTDQICTGFYRQLRNLGQVGRLLTWRRSFTVGPLLLRLPYQGFWCFLCPWLSTMAITVSSSPPSFSCDPCLWFSVPLQWIWFLPLFKFQKIRVPGHGEEKRSGGRGWEMGVGLGSQCLPVVCLLKVI